MNSALILDEVADLATGKVRATWCLPRLNEGYQRFLSGVYIGEDGRPTTHVWSFLNALANIAIADEAEATDLPAAFAGFIGVPIHRSTSTTGRPTMKPRTPEELYVLRRDAGTVDGAPEYFAVVPKADVVTDETHLYQLLTFPKADAAYTLDYRYKLKPAALTDSSTNYPIGPVEFHRGVLACALAEAEYLISRGNGSMEARAQQTLRELVRMDLDLYCTDASDNESLTDADDGMGVV
jgi:hypothetical protein